MSVNTYTIGSGETYTTIAAWEAARDGDLVAETRKEIGKLKKQAFNEIVTIWNDSSSADYHMELTCVDGAEFTKTERSGAIIESDVGYGYTIVVLKDDFCKFHKIEVQTVSPVTAMYGIALTSANTAGMVIVDRVMIRNTQSAYMYLNNCYSNALITNLWGTCVSDAGSFETGRSDDKIKLICCTVLWGLTDGTSWNAGFRYNYHRNCIAGYFGPNSSYADFTAPEVSGSDYNMSHDASAGGAHSLISKTMSNQFVDIANRDLSLKLGADAIGAGIGPSADSNVPDHDIFGNPRSGATTDMGAAMYVAAAAGGDFKSTERGILRGHLRGIRA